PGTLLSEDEVDQIEILGVDEVKVRTPLTCDTRYGLCATCYGRDLGRGHLVNVGEAVGVIAAQSIGEPGTQLTMRTFHIGGAASRTAAASQIESKSAGTVRFTPLMRYVTNAKGELIVIARSGEVMIHDDNGRERERHKVPYGATLQVKDGETAKAGKVLAQWDATARPIITVKDAQKLAVGEVLARIPQETAKTRDVPGGLPRVAELFEARSPKDAGMLAEITGTVSFGKDTKGKQRLVLADLDGVAHEFL